MPSLIKCSLVLSVFLVAAAVLAHAQSNSVVVSGARPIAEAAARLEGIYGVPITYEDPLYVHPRQMSDPTALGHTEQSSAVSTSSSIPKYGTASFTYDVPAGLSTEVKKLPLEARKKALLTTIPRVLESYAPDGTPGMFSFTELDGILHIVPKIYMERDGSVQAFSPLLDTLITISPGQRTASQLLENVCQALSTHFGHPVVVGIIPANLFAQHLTSIAGTSVSARSILSRLLLELNPSLSWQLFYDPGVQWYALNIHSVPD